ncbi:tetraspanin-33-like [Tubulanus polymorphus]|uniref:tetraspanin-33-like n=1 Tax=Tubulanus polymorphus TaxID=672921 RepID=UPI003DA46A00
MAAGGIPVPRRPRIKASYISPCLKYSIFFFNLIFWVLGIALVFIGTWAQVEKNKFNSGGSSTDISSIYDLLANVSIVIIIVGSFVFLISFAGCVGALRENICLLKTFSAVLGVIFLLEITGAVLAFVFDNEAKTKIQGVLEDELIVRYRDNADLMNLIDWMQKTFKCCGVNSLGYKDWNNNPYFNCTKNPNENTSPERCGVPFSCCVVENNVGLNGNYINAMCGYGMQNLGHIKAGEKIYTTGCVDAILKLVQENLLLVGGIAMGIAVLQIFAIFMALILARQINDQMALWTQR